MRCFYSCHQLHNQTTQAYNEYFQNQVNVELHIGGSIETDHPAMLARAAEEYGKRIEDLNETERQITHDQFVAVAVINGADHLRYGCSLSSCKATMSRELMDIQKILLLLITF
jgi:hypothetical protein